VIFGIHLLLLGYLICRSGDIPRLIGILLAIDGLGWLTDGLQPYFYANAHLGFIFITFFGELAFMLWLLIRGWKIREFPSSSQERSHQSEIARSNPGANFSPKPPGCARSDERGPDGSNKITSRLVTFSSTWNQTYVFRLERPSSGDEEVWCRMRNRSSESHYLACGRGGQRQ